MTHIIRDGMGKPMRPKQYNIFDNNYELDTVDKAIAYLTGFALVGGIVLAFFGGAA
jgi:hypothetical protein